MTPYEILGISKEATEEEIKNAYRQLVKKYHPDENPSDPKASDKLNQINRAYEFLKNPENRKALSLMDEADIVYDGYSFENHNAPETYEKPRRNVFANRTFQRVILFVVLGSMLAVNIAMTFLQAARG